MRSRSEVVAAVALALALAAGGATSRAADAAYAIVTASDVPVSDLPLDELRRVFLLKRAFWKPGKAIRLILPATGQPARAFLLERVCQRSEGELRRLVLESVYRGETDEPPKVAATEAEALGLVASLASSVAIVSADAAAAAGAKPLRIDGKLPSEPGYPLAR